MDATRLGFRSIKPVQLADNCAFLCQRYQRDKNKNTQQALAIQRLWATVEKQVWKGRIWP